MSIDGNVLTLYEPPFQKIRLGKDYDGGYVICDIPELEYDTLLSGGIDKDISFENAFCNKYKNTKCYAFDGTIDSIDGVHENIKFIKKNIGKDNNETITNLHVLLGLNKSVFVKMDIEGSEFEWINSLMDIHISNISQLVIEFHYPFNKRDNEKIFEKLNKYFYLVHFHSNNYCGYNVHNGISIPNVFECTYINKKYIKEQPELNSKTLPIDIDMRNIEQYPDYYIDYPPFVFKQNVKI